MFKYYNSALVISNRSYSIDEICYLYRDKKLHSQTIRGWIKQYSIPLIRKNPILIHGSVIKQFLHERFQQRKIKIPLDSFKCLKCRNIDRPKNDEVGFQEMANGTLSAVARCDKCGCLINRIYSRNALEELKKIFSIKPREVIINNSLSSSPKTQVEGGVKSSKHELPRGEKSYQSTAIIKLKMDI